MINFLNRYAPGIAASAFLSVACLLYIFYPDSWPGRDLMSNIFAGGIDLVFTVIFLGWILKRNEQRRTRPVRYAIYFDSCRVLSKYCGTWVDMVKSSSAEAPPVGTDLFGKEIFQLVSIHFNQNADGGGLPSAPWWQKLKLVSMEITSGIDLIVQRYQSSIDPELIGILKRIEGSPTLLCWRSLDTIRSVLASQGVDVSKFPIFVEGFTESDFRDLKDLHLYLKKASSEFKNEPGFFQPFDVSFVEATTVMNERDDISPKLGSARR